MTRPPPTVRRAGPDDIGAIIDTATAALGWDASCPNESLFRWKHLDNPAGPSPMWVAVAGEELAGFRAMLRWRLTDGRRAVRAVRAVDTATHPHHQRRGVFRTLTMAAVEELTADGVGFVFNTPNASSRPGYLEMGWVDNGRIPARVALRSPFVVPRVLRSRTAADKWSLPLADGEPVEAVTDELADLLAAVANHHDDAEATAGLRTDLTLDHLRWRYGFEPLHYRCLRADDGMAIVRLRRRGRAVEAVVADVVSPSPRTTGALFRRIAGLPEVDYVLSLATMPAPARWRPPAPGLGPRLTTRALAEDPPQSGRLRLSLGDIELF